MGSISELSFHQGKIFCTYAVLFVFGYWEEMMNKAITSISEKIGTLIRSFVGGPGHDDEEKRRRIFFALMMLVSILIMFSYGFHHLNKGNSTQGLLLLIVGLIQTISLVSLRHLQNPLIIYRINVVIFGCWLLFIMIIGIGGGAGILWMFLFPPITFILLGKKEGLLLSIITFILSLFFLIDPHSTIGTYPYETGIKTRFPVIYGLLVLMGYIVRSVLKRYEEGMENEHLKLQSEIKVRIEAEEELKKYHDHLEELVQRRTSELTVANEKLMNEVEERKQAEEALKESEEKYRSILENIAEGYYEVDLAGNFTFFNDSVCRMMGYPREELMGMNNRQYMDQENTKKLYQTFNEVYKTGKPTEEFGWEIIRKDRAKRFVGASVSLIKDLRGQPTGFRGIARDITERKQAEYMLRESETRFRDLVESSLTGIYIIQDGQIVYKNSEQDRIFGDLSEPLSFNHFKNVYPEDVEKVKEFYENIFSGKIRSFDIDMRFFPTGEMDNAADMRWVHSRASVIKYQGKEAILVNMTDITRTRELEHLVRIDDKMTSLGRVAVGITHELRNPLSGINVYLTTLKKIYDSPESLELENLEKVEKSWGSSNLLPTR